MCRFSVMVFIIFVACISMTFATSLPTNTVNYVDDSAPYILILENGLPYSEFSDFYFTDARFIEISNNSVRSSVQLIADNLSGLGITYVIGTVVTIDNMKTISFSNSLTKQQIRDAITETETVTPIREAISRIKKTMNNHNLTGTIMGNSDANGNAYGAISISSGHGNYYLSYDFTVNNFSFYAVPLSMQDQLPLLSLFKTKVEEAGCSISNYSIVTVSQHSYEKKITIKSADIEGDCARSKEYDGSKNFELVIPLETDLWSRFKAWLNGLLS